MSEEINAPQQKDEKAGCLGIGVSVLFPIIGIILYFTQKKVSNPGAYAYGALAGIILKMIMMAMRTIAAM